MLKKTISYEDFNGDEVAEDFYFNLTKAEIAEMELEVRGGLSATLEKITKAKETPVLIKIFKDLILRSYGVKSDDGKRFIKTKAMREEFEQHAAFSALFMELATDANAAAEFVNGIVPSDVSKKMKELESKKEAVKRSN